MDHASLGRLSSCGSVWIVTNSSTRSLKSTTSTARTSRQRWIVSSSAEIQRYACEQGLATMAVAKIDAVKMVKEELL